VNVLLMREAQQFLETFFAPESELLVASERRAQKVAAADKLPYSASAALSRVSATRI
jgi:hypothetical protein